MVLGTHTFQNPAEDHVEVRKFSIYGVESIRLLPHSKAVLFWGNICISYDYTAAILIY